MYTPPLQLPTGASPATAHASADPELRLATRAMHALLLAHLLLWTLVPALTQSAPPWDNIEQLVWAQSLEWGYYKHPPAPTWWVAGWVALLGHHVWVTYLAAQACVVAALWLVWRIALQVTTPARAFAATALTLLVAYHGMRGTAPNHNTLQLLPVAMLLFALLEAVRTGRWSWWAATGAAGALCLLSKYSAAVWFAAAFAWLLVDRRMDRSRWLHAALACLLGFVLASPHILWLLNSGGSSIAYAQVALSPSDSWSTVATSLAHYTGSQVARLLPFAAALGLLVWRLRKDTRVAPQPLLETNFVLLLGVGPFVLSLLLGSAGVPLHASWASTFFLLAGLLVLRWIPAVQPRRLVRAAFAVALALNGLMAAADGAAAGWLANAAGRNARANFPAERLSSELQEAWRHATGQPLRVVSGETWMAGVIAAHWPGRPRVLIDGAVAKAPWVEGDTLDACGYLAVFQRSADLLDRPGNVVAQVDRAPVNGRIELAWGGRDPLIVEYGIKPPTAACTRSPG